MTGRLADRISGSQTDSTLIETFSMSAMEPYPLCAHFPLVRPLKVLPFRLAEGVPQGGPLSGHLFNVGMIHPFNKLNATLGADARGLTLYDIIKRHLGTWKS